MPLPGYGLLIGTITASRPQRGGSPHWLLFVQPADAQHPPYRVAVNMQSTVAGQPPEVEYQIIDFDGRSSAAARKLIDALKKLGATPSFQPVASDPSLPTLDFVRGRLLDVSKFTPLPARSNPLRNAFAQTLGQAARADASGGSLIAVFGTGDPIDKNGKGSVPTGFTGIENIHMNQGSLNLINSDPHYLENGPNQDGGLIFLSPDGTARGFFVKFQSQTTQTDAHGNPTISGVPELDSMPAATRKAITPPLPRARATPASASGSPGTANNRGFVFADVDPNHASGTYKPDLDGNYQTPYVMTRSKGTTAGPVPSPRAYPRLDLSSIVGSNPVGYTRDKNGERLAFDIIGDSGAANESSLDNQELKVTDLMVRNAQASPPAFLFHVGDVVYYYGEQDYYYSQFFEPFRAYPAPIFAIPGNHDGITYNDAMVSLDAFQKAFCATTPQRWPGAGGILRSTMTQPGVYFTLDAPLVSIIGLYSNCGEYFGFLDQPQLIFLHNELVRLKALRKDGLPAVILAIHHFPRWFPGQSHKDPNSTAIDAVCQSAGFWPDAVICGHAHLYQRVVRQDSTIGKDIPYVMAGAGGYGLKAFEEVGRNYMSALKSTRLGRVLVESGYARATVAKPASGDPTLTFEYHSIKQTSAQPDDVCVINLKTGKLST